MATIEISNNFRNRYQDQHFSFDPNSAAAQLDGRYLTLTRKESELLSMLVEHNGEIIPRDVLLSRVWGYSKEVRTRTLDVHIRRLRRKLNPFGEQYIETIFGVGYRFQRYREPRAFSAFAPTLIAVGM